MVRLTLMLALQGLAALVPPARAQSQEINLNSLSFHQGFGTNQVRRGDGYVICDGECLMMASLDLPDGATIEIVTLFALDNSDSDDVLFSLERRFGTPLDLSETLGSAHTVAAFSWVQTASINDIVNPIVDNQTYMYWIEVILEAPTYQHRFMRVSVKYSSSATGIATTESATKIQPPIGYPNPFGENTSVRFALSSTQTVQVRVHDAKGRLVRTIHSGALGSGTHDLPWDGRDRSGQRVSSGVYYVRVTTGQRELVFKVVRLD